jgi:restriction system protein
VTLADSLRTAAPLYQDATLNEMLEHQIAAADEESLHAAVRWDAEHRLLEQVLLTLQTHCDVLDREHSHTHRRAEHEPYFDDPACTPTTFLCARTARSLERLLNQELRWAREDIAEAARLQQQLRSQAPRRVERYRQHPRSTPELDVASDLLHDLSESAGRVQALLAGDREQLHALALEEQQAQVFMDSPASTNLQQIEEMTHRRFEQLVSSLAARDGLDVERYHGGPYDEGADVIATSPAGHRMVFQCKHTQRAKTVGVPAIRELSGVAGPIHNADVAIVITNGTFTKPAEKFARKQNITTLSWWVLVRWATWGESLLDILDLEEPAGLAA